MAKTAKKAAKKAAPKKKVTKGKPADPVATVQFMEERLTSLKADLEEFTGPKEVRVAGKRVRGYAMEIRRAAGALRKEIQAIVNERKS